MAEFSFCPKTILKYCILHPAPSSKRNTNRGEKKDLPSSSRNKTQLAAQVRDVLSSPSTPSLHAWRNGRRTRRRCFANHACVGVAVAGRTPMQGKQLPSIAIICQGTCMQSSTTVHSYYKVAVGPMMNPVPCSCMQCSRVHPDPPARRPIGGARRRPHPPTTPHGPVVITIHPPTRTRPGRPLPTGGSHRRSPFPRAGPDTTQ